MSAGSTAGTPLVLFGDLDADLWGVVIGGDRPRAALAPLAQVGVELRDGDLDTSEPDVWTLAGVDCELRVERAETTTATDAHGTLEPCRVSGSAHVTGARREFDLGGVRGERLAPAPGASLRLFAAWFPAGHQIALLGERPRGAKGQDRDELEVVARGETHPLVVDPRLSTTYAADGAPRRAAVELWLGESAEGELWPRRLAGAATGAAVAGPDFTAHAFRCVSRGEPGAGVYLLRSG